MIDINDIYSEQQQLCKHIKGILYYDETNNFRRLRLTEDGTNNEIENINFVLGGIGSLSREPIDYSTLLSELKIQKSAKEIKFHHFTKKETDFIEILKSQQLNILFKWINTNDNFFIHFSSMNYVFYILIDIVDEALERYPGIYHYHLGLKNALYEAIKPNLDVFIKQLYSFGFPDINTKDIRNFVELVLAHVELRQDKTLTGMDNMFTEFLRQIIKAMRNDKEFVFLSDVEKYELFKAYADLYSREIVVFNEAHLIFDHETDVEPKLKLQVSKQSNYEFKDSKDDVSIQISDVIVGFVSKLITYIESNYEDDIYQELITMTSMQKENLQLFFKIENHSNDICKCFFNHIQPTSSREKMELLYSACFP
ncbi:MAG: hypothetical protein LBC87_08015 [Fibromonadaceae bacterium]|jgi:hypothetical protein|nr:hypothetical protein [Fibromonadaceae bacterium]